MHPRPQRRVKGIVFERLDEGAVIYDSETQQAHALDALTTRVFVGADGTRTPLEIAVAFDFDDEASVNAAIEQLDARGLLVSEGVSRRAMLKKAAVVGASATAVAPLIDTVIIPTAAAHASTGMNPSGGGGQPGGGTLVGANAMFAGTFPTFLGTGGTNHYEVTGSAGTSSGSFTSTVSFDVNGDVKVDSGSSGGYVNFVVGNYNFIAVANNSPYSLTVVDQTGAKPSTIVTVAPEGYYSDSSGQAGGTYSWSVQFIV